MDIGVFDHLDRLDVPLPGFYESRLRHLEQYDAGGFCFHPAEHLTKLWRDIGAVPIRFARDFDEAGQRGLAIARPPARVGEEIERQVAVSRCSYFVCRLMFVDRPLRRRGSAAHRRARSCRRWPMTAKACVLELGMGVGVHGRDSTKVACRAWAVTIGSVEYPGASG